MRQEKIKTIIEKLLNIKIEEYTNIKLTEIEEYDSMKLVKIIMDIQSIDNKVIPLNKLNKISKIKDLLEL